MKTDELYYASREETVTVKKCKNDETEEFEYITIVVKKSDGSVLIDKTFEKGPIQENDINDILSSIGPLRMKMKNNKVFQTWEDLNLVYFKTLIKFTSELNRGLV